MNTTPGTESRFRWAKGLVCLVGVALLLAVLVMPSWAGLAAPDAWRCPPTISATGVAARAATIRPTATTKATATVTASAGVSAATRVLAEPDKWPESQLDTLSRFGVAAINLQPLYYLLSREPIGWYLDYNFRLAPARPNRFQAKPGSPKRVQFVQMVPIESGIYPANWSVLRDAIRANPGSIWIVGNEPESIFKGNRTPEEYAPIYHEYYAFIKAEDPTALIMIGGVVQPTPLRLQWLDRVLKNYEQRYGAKMPVDIWNIHNTTLREKKGDYGAGIPAGINATQGRLYDWWQVDDIDIFKQHVVDMRRWMAARGERDKPLFITEYGFLYPSSWFDALDGPSGNERVRIYMGETFAYLLEATDDKLGYPADENRLVQRWAWYSLNGWRWEEDAVDGFNGELFTFGTRKMTLHGEHYRELVSEILEGE